MMCNSHVIWSYTCCNPPQNLAQNLIIFLLGNELNVIQLRHGQNKWRCRSHAVAGRLAWPDDLDEPGFSLAAWVDDLVGPFGHILEVDDLGRRSEQVV